MTLTSATRDKKITIPAVLDTGASLCLISTGLAVKLGYAPHGRMKRQMIFTGSRIELCPVITIRVVEALGFASQNLAVLCHELPKGSGITALLGLNFLKRFDFCVLTSKGVITIR